MCMCTFTQVVMALTEDNKLRVPEVMSVLRLVQDDIQPNRLLQVCCVCVCVACVCVCVCVCLR